MNYPTDDPMHQAIRRSLTHRLGDGRAANVFATAIVDLWRQIAQRLEPFIKEKTMDTAMDKANPPQTFGVFKPVDHTVITYKTAADMQSGVDALATLGFKVSDMARYSPPEMQALVDAQLIAASPLASFGYELDLIKIHREMAQQGCSFLVVYAPQESQADQVAAVAQVSHAVAAQHYGTFMIREVLEPTPGETSVP